MRDGYWVLDAHTHIGEWGTWELKGSTVSPFQNPITSKERLRQHMERYGVDRQLVMPHYHPDLEQTFEDNHLAVELAGLGSVHAAVFFEPSHAGRLEKVKELAARDEAVALKTSADAWENGDYDPGSWGEEQTAFMDEILEFAADEGLPIHFHTGSERSDPRKLFALIDEYPQVTYHCVHSGGTAGGHFAFVPRFLERLDLEIYCDTSWSRGFGARWIARELEERGALDRLLFASDEPWGDLPGEFAKVEGLELEEDDKQRILYGNAAELYGLG